MTDKENITAILECYFSGFKKEIIDSACNRIIQELDHQPIFRIGYEQGRKDAIENGKIIGREEAWECVRKISNMDFKTRKKALSVNPCHDSLGEIVNNFSVSDAISKIKEYEEKQKQANDEIKVGDEVADGEVFNSGKGIVTFASPAVIYVLWYDGSTGRRKLEDIKKTGRHFDQITEVLEQLKREKEEVDE